MSDKFQRAYLRAREKIGEDAWRLLSDQERENAVARELRAIEGGTSRDRRR